MQGLGSIMVKKCADFSGGASAAGATRAAPVCEPSVKTGVFRTLQRTDETRRLSIENVGVEESERVLPPACRPRLSMVFFHEDDTADAHLYMHAQLGQLRSLTHEDKDAGVDDEQEQEDEDHAADADDSAPLVQFSPDMEAALALMDFSCETRREAVCAEPTRSRCSVDDITLEFDRGQEFVGQTLFEELYGTGFSPKTPDSLPPLIPISPDQEGFCNTFSLIH